MMHCVFNDTATTEIYTLSLHDALPISQRMHCVQIIPIETDKMLGSGAFADLGSPKRGARLSRVRQDEILTDVPDSTAEDLRACRSEEHTPELQSRQYLVCRLLLEKKHT